MVTYGCGETLSFGQHSSRRYALARVNRLLGVQARAPSVHGTLFFLPVGWSVTIFTGKTWRYGHDAKADPAGSVPAGQAHLHPAGERIRAGVAE